MLQPGSPRPHLLDEMSYWWNRTALHNTESRMFEKKAGERAKLMQENNNSNYSASFVLSNGKKWPQEREKKNPRKKHCQFNLQWKATVEEVISLGNMHGRPFRCTPIRFSWSAVIFKSDTGWPCAFVRCRRASFHEAHIKAAHNGVCVGIYTSN